MTLTLCEYRTLAARLDLDTHEDNWAELEATLSETVSAQLRVFWPEVAEVLANNDGECRIEIADVIGSDDVVVFRIFTIPWGSALVFAAESTTIIGTVVQHDPAEFVDPETAAALQTALQSSTAGFKAKIRFA